MSDINSLKYKILSYFNEFSSALSTYLRPYNEKLGDQYLGAAKRELTALVYFGDGFVCARLDARQLGPTVVEWLPENSETLGLCTFKEFADMKKRFRLTFGEMIFRFSDGRIVTLYDIEEGDKKRVGVQFRTGPEVSWVVLSPRLHGTRLDHQTNSNKTYQHKNELGFEFTSPWLWQCNCRRLEDGSLEGLDADPKISAFGVAEKILEYAGLVPSPIRKKYDDARQALETAIKSLSHENENAIHPVIEKFPYILVSEFEYDDFASKPRLKYTEDVQLEHGVMEGVERPIEPDFLYFLVDGSVLCVEIEAYTKRLFITAMETSFSVPASPTSKANYQIENYNQIVESYGRKEICRQLECPTVTMFKFLLVVGSKLQPDFDKRSWVNRQRVLNDGGIELQNWDFYLERLKRAAEACDFKPGKENTS